MFKVLLSVLLLSTVFVAQSASAGYRCNLARRGCYDGGGKYNTYKKNANNYWDAVRGCRKTAERNGHKFCEVKSFTYTPGKSWYYCQIARNYCANGGGRYNGLVKAKRSWTKWRATAKCQTLANRNGHILCD